MVLGPFMATCIHILYMVSLSCFLIETLLYMHTCTAIEVSRQGIYALNTLNLRES